MIEVFDEKDVEECLSEVKDSDIKTYAFWLLDWAVQKRKIQAIPLDEVKQAREEISKLHITNIAEGFGDYVGYIDSDMVFKILDKLIESEG